MAVAARGGGGGEALGARALAVPRGPGVGSGGQGPGQAAALRELLLLGPRQAESPPGWALLPGPSVRKRRCGRVEQQAAAAPEHTATPLTEHPDCCCSVMCIRTEKSAGKAKGHFPCFEISLKAASSLTNVSH